MKRKIVLLLHALYWALYMLLLTFLFTILLNQAGGKVAVLPLLFASRVGFALFIPESIAFYLAYAFLFPKYLANRRLLPMIAGTLLVSLLAVSLCSPLFAHTPPLEGVAVGACLQGLVLIHMALAMILRGFIQWYGDISVKEELRQRTTEAELALLRAKLDSHFLFNTLNNIDVLVARDPNAASLYLNNLSEILRFVLYEAQADNVPLEAELAYVSKYIALQRIRSADPDFVTWEVTGEPGGWGIAPLLLMPFIENAFKHADRQQQGNTIAVAIAIYETHLEFHCRNRYRKGAVDTASGLGNALTQRRLALLYPGRYRLDVSNHEDTYAVLLRIEREGNQESHALHHR